MRARIAFGFFFLLAMRGKKERKRVGFRRATNKPPKKKNGDTECLKGAKMQRARATVNSFAQKDTDGTYDGIPDELKKLIAAYAVCETHVRDLEDIDKVVEAVNVDVGMRAHDILEHYEMDGVVPNSILSNSVRAAIGKNDKSRVADEETEEKRKIIERKSHVKLPRTIEIANATPIHDPRATYMTLVLCGSLWHSGLLTTILGVLGWSKVANMIREIETGVYDKEAGKAGAGTKEMIGKATKSWREKAIEATKRTRPFRSSSGTSFGALTTYEAFIKDQEERAKGSRNILEAPNASGFGPQFLVAHIRAVALDAKQQFFSKLHERPRDEVTFRLVAYASACVMCVLAKHVETCLPKIEESALSDADSVVNALVELLERHTAIPSKKHGTIQMLLQLVNAAIKRNSLKDTRIYGPSGHLTDNADKILQRLAKLESDGHFSHVLSNSLKTDIHLREDDLFHLYMPMYSDKSNTYITTTSTSATRDLIMGTKGLAEANIRTALTDKHLPATRDGSDAFESVLNSYVNMMVRVTWDAVQCEEELNSTVQRASAYVSTARRVEVKADADVYLREIIGKIRDPDTSGTEVSSITKDGMLQAVCYALDNFTTGASNEQHDINKAKKHARDAYQDAMERADAGHVLRRQILSDFVGEIIITSKQSTLKFLAMMKQLVVNMPVEFTQKEDTRAVLRAVGTAQNAFSDEDNDVKTQILHAVGSSHFAAEEKIGEDSKQICLLNGDSTVSILHDTNAKLETLIALTRSIFFRLPSDFFDKDASGKKVLKIDKLRSEIANVASQDTAKKQNIETLERRHEVLKLLGVQYEHVRAAISDPLRTSLVYAVAFKDNTKATHCYRIFVNANGDNTNKMQRKLQLLLTDFVMPYNTDEERDEYTDRTLATNKVVFGKDEWGSLLVKGTELRKNFKADEFRKKFTATAKLEERATITKPSYMHEDHTLFVHRWLESEFIPAPYASATPIFWYSARSLRLLFENAEAEAKLGFDGEPSSREGLANLDHFLSGTRADLFRFLESESALPARGGLLTVEGGDPGASARVPSRGDAPGRVPSSDPLRRVPSSESGSSDAPAQPGATSSRLAAAAAVTPEPAAAHTFKLGDKVTLHNISSNASFNGAEGVIESINPTKADGKRYGVSFLHNGDLKASYVSATQMTLGHAAPAAVTPKPAALISIGSRVTLQNLSSQASIYNGAEAKIVKIDNAKEDGLSYEVSFMHDGNRKTGWVSATQMELLTRE